MPEKKGEMPSSQTQTGTVAEASDYEKELDSVSSKIKSSEEFNKCLSQNIAMCSQSVGMELAQKQKSAEFCRELKGTEQQNSCAFAVTIINATEKKDIKLCDTLSGTYVGRCKVELYRADALEKKDIKLCENIKTLVSGEIDTQNRDDANTQCIMNVIMSNPASTANDCKAIANSQMQEMCAVSIKTRLNTPNVPLPSSNR
jgi:hypothetical protein